MSIHTNGVNSCKKGKKIMIEISEYSTPYEVANALIYATKKVRAITGKEIEEDAYDLTDLKHIGEYLMHYAKVESESEENWDEYEQ